MFGMKLNNTKIIYSKRIYIPKSNFRYHFIVTET